MSSERTRSERSHDKTSFMEALIAKANDIHPLAKKPKARKYASHKSDQKTRPSGSTDPTLNSISKQTALPKSLRPSSPLPENVPTHSHIAKKKLRTRLNRTSAHAVRSKALLKDAELLLINEPGKMEAEGEMERTWRIGQDEIVKEAGKESSKGRREWKLDGGPYRCRYTRNGRFVVIS
jgi:U3 small nucleolar RNA-associated protein 7